MLGTCSLNRFPLWVTPLKNFKSEVAAVLHMDSKKPETIEDFSDMCPSTIPRTKKRGGEAFVTYSKD